MTASSDTSDSSAKNAKRALKVRLVTYLAEILTNEVGTSIIQLEDTLNLPESNLIALFKDHNCICPYCAHTLCNLLETKNFISTYNMEDRLAMMEQSSHLVRKESADISEERKELTQKILQPDQNHEEGQDYQFKLDVVQEELKVKTRRSPEYVEIKKSSQAISEQSNNPDSNMREREFSPTLSPKTKKSENVSKKKITDVN